MNANDVLDMPTPLKALRRMLSGTDNPAEMFWNTASLRERENLIFHCRPNLGKSHVGLSWDDFDVNQRRTLWNGLLSLRGMYEKTITFRPEHFRRGVFLVSTDPLPDVEEPGSNEIPSIN